MNDPQIWTLIGVVTALIFASNRQLSTSIRREMQAGFRAVEAKFDTFDTKIDALDAKFDTKIDALDAKFDAKIDALDAKIDTKVDALEAKMDARFTDVDHRLESLESDMHLIKAHLIGQSVTPARG